MFAIQIYESTDNTNFAVLLIIARYFNDNEDEESLLLCHFLSERTIGKKWILIGPIIVDYKVKMESQCRVYILVY